MVNLVSHVGEHMFVQIITTAKVTGEGRGGHMLAVVEHSHLTYLCLYPDSGKPS